MNSFYSVQEGHCPLQASTSVSSASVSSAFSNDISETAGQSKIKLSLGPPWGGGRG